LPQTHPPCQSPTEKIAPKKERSARGKEMMMTTTTTTIESDLANTNTDEKRKRTGIIDAREARMTTMTNRRKAADVDEKNAAAGASRRVVEKGKAKRDANVPTRRMTPRIVLVVLVVLVVVAILVMAMTGAGKKRKR
jgi:hypothetical protein